MTSNPIENRMSISETDISTPSSTQKYPLGMTYEVDDSTDGATIEKQFIYVKDGVGMAAKGIYTINPMTWTTATPATNSVGTLYGISNVTGTSGYYQFVQTGGTTNVTSTTDTTNGDTGKMANSVATMTDESGTAETALSVGKILAARTGSGSVSINLIPNKRATI